MKLTEKDIQEMKQESFSKEWFLDFLGRLKVDLFDPQKLTTENLQGKKEAVTILEEEIEKPMRRSGASKEAPTNKEYR